MSLFPPANMIYTPFPVLGSLLCPIHIISSTESSVNDTGFYHESLDNSLDSSNHCCPFTLNDDHSHTVYRLHCCQTCVCSQFLGSSLARMFRRLWFPGADREKETVSESGVVLPLLLLPLELVQENILSLRGLDSTF